MSNKSKRSGHWTSDELVAHLYGVGPDDGHLETCAACQDLAASMQANRDKVRQTQADVSNEFLTAQRRRIYARLDEPVRWNVRRWASAMAAMLVLAGGLVVYERHDHSAYVMDNKVTDAQLADDVSRMSQNPEPDSAAPLQSLFVE